MALLATKRLLTKNEIFSSVAGYSGSLDSMERMFERDKDDLRSLGIDIEVAPLDSYFEDELGYRIRPEAYALEMPELNPTELALLTIAAHTWKNSLFSQSAQSALRKIESLGIEIDPAVLQTDIVPVENYEGDLTPIWTALSERRIITFIYSRESSEERSIEPYGMSIFKGEWYLAGKDISKGELRTFKVRRMSSIISSGKKGAFVRPENFSFDSTLLLHNDDALIKVRMRIRKNRALGVRSSATLIDDSKTWDLYEKVYSFEGSAIHDALWYSQDIVIIEPKVLRNRIQSLLNEKLQDSL